MRILGRPEGEETGTLQWPLTEIEAVTSNSTAVSRDPGGWRRGTRGGKRVSMDWKYVFLKVFNVKCSEWRGMRMHFLSTLDPTAL